MVELGREYKDKITGFKGVAIGFVQYISGCNQGLLAPSVGEDGAMKDAQWIDEQRLTPVGDEVITLTNGETPGFDIPAPSRQGKTLTRS
jgi:hypothetical protein